DRALGAAAGPCRQRVRAGEHPAHPGGQLRHLAHHDLVDRREALHQAHLSESITLFNSPAHGQAAFATLERSIVQQAYMLATNDLFWLWGWTFLALIAVVWFARPPFSAAGKHAAAD